MVTIRNVVFSAKTQLWCVVTVVILAMVVEVATLNGNNVCMVKQKYNITKRVKYRAPMSVRTYVWCMSIPPRCSKWSTEMRDLTRLETEERTAEVAVCCPGYKMKDVSCVPICPDGRTGRGCSQQCPPNKWGPNCVNECKDCSDHGSCSPTTGECSCQDGWQGESCESRMSATTSTTTTTARVEELLTKKPATKPYLPSSIPSTTATALLETSPISTSIFETTMTSGSNRPNTINTTSLSTTVTLQRTTTPVPVEDFTSSKTEVEIKNTQPTNIANLLENATIKLNPSTTPMTTVLATINTTTKSSVTMHVIQKTTSAKPGTSEDYFKSILKNSRNMETIANIENLNDEFTTDPIITTVSYNPTVVFKNMPLTTVNTHVYEPITHANKKITINTLVNSTEGTPDIKKYPNEVHVEIKTTPVRILKSSDNTNTAVPQNTTAFSVFTETPVVFTHATTITEESTKMETTKRPDATFRYFPTTVKFKPKEIWIRPAQKGESFESKKTNELNIRHRVATNKEPQNTTPKTIIVSIIPTSVSYATFKKIALTTASVITQTTNMTLKQNYTGQGFTKPMSVLTTLSPQSSNISTSPASAVAHETKQSIIKSVNSSKSNEYFQQVAKTLSTLSNAKTAWRNQTVSLNGTNSMETVTQNLNSSNFVTQTVSSTNFITTTHKASAASIILRDATRHSKKVTMSTIKVVTAKPLLSEKRNATVKTAKTEKEKTNVTKITAVSNANTNKITTESPDDEETFHILTEPEHITAVMEGKEKQKSSVDLISVISIAGGIMMAVITVAVIIVMVERCRRPRYEDASKMSEIHMQVMIDNNDVPPPYVRSIFHTPLPDPPSLDKCHYQPISTLDRNLKQFMRPVVVQAISPIMLENFRGILECHYDHLPRRSHDFEARPKHCSITPSSDDPNELSHLRPNSIAESTIDALKCEAKLDVLDSTTSEPLYAEIPCWRPPSEHAIEIMNYNDEAVTEL